ncbi:sugar transferase [Roseovarius amoyensis]|uniref:sugar transferase n=1 Tax=Roseovarius amoyensis TaxID=2211448 RepID=UPI000DBE30D5|nr:sugar transferase [Roseovarius amoyensis]
MKRLLDILGAGVALLLLSPVFLVVALLILWQMGRPVILRQFRPGPQGHPFEMIEFRTMREANDGQGNPLPDAERLTRLGRFLRASSLDELPELWNALRGEMGLVGPRPLLREHLVPCSSEQACSRGVWT